MQTNLLCRLWEFKEQIHASDLQSFACLDNPNSFTRKRKMPLDDLLLCILSNHGLTTYMELKRYFTHAEKEDQSISKQAYFQKRRHLNHEVFIRLNAQRLKAYYSDKVRTWHGYLVLTIDGSKCEVPNSQDNKNHFGCTGNKHSQGPARTQISCAYDLFNAQILDLQIEPVRSNEINLAKENIDALLNIIDTDKYPLLLVLDRGYPSIEFIDWLERKNIHYLMRITSTCYKKERAQMKTSDEVVALEHTDGYRINKIKQYSPERAAQLAKKGVTYCRILSVPFADQKTATFITDLQKKFTEETIADLYHQRWEIEKTYDTLKNKLKFESVTGAKPIYVYQDYWAHVLVLNLLNDIIQAANQLLPVEKRKKYKINRNLAIGLLMHVFVELLTVTKRRALENILHQLLDEIGKHLHQIRPSKTNPRKKRSSNKYRMNLKPSF